jgi:all-trans-retinol 13,14-reductase
MGGQVLVKKKVTKIECDHEKATAVLTDTGERFPADLVISAIHPALTVQLIDSRLIRPSYRQRILNDSNTISAFTVYLKFRENSVRYMNKNLYIYRGDSIWGCEKYDESSWPKFILYMHFCHENNPEFARSGEILTYMNFSDVQQWCGTHIDQRGESYEMFKKRKAEAAIDVLEKEIPGIRDHIEDYYTSSPLTYYDYTGVPDGAMYGISKDVQNIVSGSVTSRTKIPNLLLTGQSITLHGMLGVLAGSLATCSEVLTIDEIFHQLKHAG